MIDTAKFFNFLAYADVDYFAGVPDSLLSAFGAYVADHVPDDRHVIAANEGAAVALAAGRYLATGRTGLVYFQNSGQGNMVNPLVSLADPEVYSIPMLLLAGWRAAPGVHDEPQHVKQGRITIDIFKAMEIPVEILPDETDAAVQVAKRQLDYARAHNCPAALLVKPGIFSAYSLKQKEADSSLMEREKAIRLIVGALPVDTAIVSTTGHISRELYEHRDLAGQSHERDFYTVGSMGHASQIALGVASAQPERPVVCLDGDGAMLMHMGAMAIVGKSPVSRKFYHVVLNNGAHGSVGGQPTVGFGIDMPAIARACGYCFAERVDREEDLGPALERLLKSGGPSFLEVRVGRKARKDLGRPKTTPSENKKLFMRYLGCH
jgi:phosphonopyruvate decarboxylase